MSLESPLVRLDRELREFARTDFQPALSPASMVLIFEDLTAGNVITVVTDNTARLNA